MLGQPGTSEIQGNVFLFIATEFLQMTSAGERSFMRTLKSSKWRLRLLRWTALPHEYEVAGAALLCCSTITVIQQLGNAVSAGLSIGVISRF
jgi:hypothetical protein